MIVIKTGIDKLPKCCEECSYFRIEPDITYYWVALCGLYEDKQIPDKNIYTQTKPPWCPLMEVEDE